MEDFPNQFFTACRIGRSEMIEIIAELHTLQVFFFSAGIVGIIHKSSHAFFVFSHNIYSGNPM